MAGHFLRFRLQNLIVDTFPDQTPLFGGFGRSFYDGYEAEWAMEPGHQQRLKLYQLYHVLNHLNLFGSSYLGRAKQLLRELL